MLYNAAINFIRNSILFCLLRYVSLQILKIFIRLLTCSIYILLCANSLLYCFSSAVSSPFLGFFMGCSAFSWMFFMPWYPLSQRIFTFPPIAFIILFFNIVKSCSVPSALYTCKICSVSASTNNWYFAVWRFFYRNNAFSDYF